MNLEALRRAQRDAIVGALLLLVFLPSPAFADEKYAVWGEFIYTLPSFAALLEAGQIEE